MIQLTVQSRYSNRRDWIVDKLFDVHRQSLSHHVAIKYAHSLAASYDPS